MTTNRYETETTSIARPRVSVERDRHLVPYLVYPFLGSLLFSAILSVCVGILTWNGAGFETGKNVALIVFCVSLVVTFPLLFIWRGLQWAGPRVLAQIDRRETTSSDKRHTKPGSERIRVIPVNRRNKGYDISPKKDDPDVLSPKEFCDVLFSVWATQDLTRDNFGRLFRGGQRLYYKYVGGRGKRGLWDRLGIIEQDGHNGAWAFSLPLNEIVSIDRDVQRYARQHYPPTPSG